MLPKAGLELSLKALLHEVHPAFVYVKIESPKHTVTPSVAIERLAQVSGHTISTTDRSKIETAIELRNKIIHSEEEISIDYDLLITIPPHRGAKVITDSDLGAGGWVPTDRNTLQMDGKSNVFVCGDTTNLPISKAGSTAHFEADTIIDNLVSLVTEGRMATHYDGKVFCFIETGMRESTYVWFNYENPPNPGPPSQMLHWFKLAYNRLYWLSARGLL